MTFSLDFLEVDSEVLSLNAWNLTGVESVEDFQLAIPLSKGQLSTREVLNGLEIKLALTKGAPVKITDVSGPYSENKELRALIENRGI